MVLSELRRYLSTMRRLAHAGHHRWRHYRSQVGLYRDKPALDDGLHPAELLIQPRALRTALPKNVAARHGHGSLPALALLVLALAWLEQTGIGTMLLRCWG